MIEIRMERDSAGSMTGFSVRGHAQAAPHGQDIVCAAVSALAQSAVLGLERYLAVPLQLRVEEGLLLARLEQSPDAQSNAVLETMLLGLREIERLYPRYVRIRENRR